MNFQQLSQSDGIMKPSDLLLGLCCEDNSRERIAWSLTFENWKSDLEWTILLLLLLFLLRILNTPCSKTLYLHVTQCPTDFESQLRQRLEVCSVSWGWGSGASLYCTVTCSQWTPPLVLYTLIMDLLNATRRNELGIDGYHSKQSDKRKSKA